MKKMLVPCALDPPNPKCYVCAAKPEVSKVTPRELSPLHRPACRMLLSADFHPTISSIPSSFPSAGLPLSCSVSWSLCRPFFFTLTHDAKRDIAGVRWAVQCRWLSTSSLSSAALVLLTFQVTVHLDTTKVTVKTLEDKVLSPHLRCPIAISAIVMYRGLGVAGQLCNAQVLRRKFDTWYQTSRASKAGVSRKGPGPSWHDLSPSHFLSPFFRAQVLKEHFGMVAPDVEIDDGKGRVKAVCYTAPRSAVHLDFESTIIAHNDEFKAVLDSSSARAKAETFFSSPSLERCL